MYGGVNLPRHAKPDRASVGVKGTRCQGMQGTLVTYTETREKAFISNVIKAEFKAIGLVSFNSQKVLKRFPNRAITSEV